MFPCVCFNILPGTWTFWPLKELILGRTEPTASHPESTRSPLIRHRQKHSSVIYYLWATLLARLHQVQCKPLPSSSSVLPIISRQRRHKFPSVFFFHCRQIPNCQIILILWALKRGKSLWRVITSHSQYWHASKRLNSQLPLRKTNESGWFDEQRMKHKIHSFNTNNKLAEMCQKFNVNFS